MKVLAIIPTNESAVRTFSAAYFKEAVESLENQTRPADAIYITGNVGSGFISNGCLADRLNDAIEKHPDCDAFFMLSDDDKLDPKFIEKTAGVMERAGVDIVYTDLRIFGNRNNRCRPPGRWNQEDIERNTVPYVTSLCTRRAWEKAGKYVAVPMFDWDFWWRCFYTGATAAYLPEPLFFYREHSNSSSAHEDLMRSRQSQLDRHNLLRPQYTGTQGR